MNWPKDRDKYIEPMLNTYYNTRKQKEITMQSKSASQFDEVPNQHYSSLNETPVHTQSIKQTLKIQQDQTYVPGTIELYALAERSSSTC